MKTPHTIQLLNLSKPKLNPDTGKRDRATLNEWQAPCLFNYIQQAKVFEMYGDRTIRIGIARFNQAQEPFSHAKYDGRVFVPIESIDAPIKGAVRLKEVHLDGVL